MATYISYSLEAKDKLGKTISGYWVKWKELLKNIAERKRY